MHIAVNRFWPLILTIIIKKRQNKQYSKLFYLTERWIKDELDKLIKNLNQVNRNRMIKIKIAAHGLNLKLLIDN